MALWLKLHDTLPDHKKLIAAAKVLKIDRDLLMGKLVRLWLWAATNREDGFIAADDVEVAAEKMRWQGDAQELFDALCVVPPGYATGLLERVEGGYIVHDWADHVGALMDMREAQREQARIRQQRRRDRLRSEPRRDASDTVTDASRVTVTDVTRDSNACHATKTKRRLREDKEYMDTGDTGVASAPPALDLSAKPKKPVFKIPTLEEVQAYCAERGNQVDPQRFLDFYEANGWRVGRNPMRDWKAAVRTWEQRNDVRPGQPQKPASRAYDPFSIPNDPDRYKHRDDDFGDEFMRRLEAKQRGQA